jgi:hypothetical protein
MGPTNALQQLQQYGQGTSRGFWAGGLGAPADMVNALLNLLIAGGGYAGHKTGLLDRPPDLLGPPVGGSEWIAEIMRRGGLLADTPGSTADSAGNFTGGLLGLLAGAKPVVSRPANALMRLAEAPAKSKIAGLFSDANASKFVGREAPKVPQRDFSLDYPNQANLGPVGSRLTHDVDGYPLGTGPIAGRRTVGGLDEAQGSSNALDIARAFGVPIEAVPAAQIRPDVGRISSRLGRWEPGTAPTPYADPRIQVSRELDAAGFDRTVSHEIGHLIDKMAGHIKQDGISSELGRLYSDLNTRGWVSKWQKGAKPQDFKYVGDDIKRELMAEAVHAYRISPNYIKSVAPKTAAAIRQAARSVDGLNKTIQFNSLAPAGGAGLLGAGLFADDTNARR